MLFRLTDVHKAYGAQEVLRGATLQINPGEHVGLVGHGAYKTRSFGWSTMKRHLIWAKSCARAD
jgi:ABC-type histidine transport system ATPase subunit